MLGVGSIWLGYAGVGYAGYATRYWLCTLPCFMQPYHEWVWHCAPSRLTSTWCQSMSRIQRVPIYVSCWAYNISGFDERDFIFERRNKQKIGCQFSNNLWWQACCLSADCWDDSSNLKEAYDESNQPETTFTMLAFLLHVSKVSNEEDSWWKITNWKQLCYVSFFYKYEKIGKSHYGIAGIFIFFCWIFVYASVFSTYDHIYN